MLATNLEPKTAEILQQILVSHCWLDYDEVKQDMRANDQHPAIAQLTTTTQIDFNIVQENNFYKIFISCTGLESLRQSI